MSRSAAHAVGLFVTSRAEPDGRVIAALRGGLDIASAPALREKLLGLLRPGASRLVVDLSAVGYADASGFAVLVGAGRRAGLLGGWLRLASPTPDVARVLSVTGLDRHLATFPTVADAITGRRPDAGTAEAGTGNAGHVAPIRPAAALPTRYVASRPSWATDWHAECGGGDGAVVTIVGHRARHDEHRPDEFHCQLIRVVVGCTAAMGRNIASTR